MLVGELLEKAQQLFADGAASEHLDPAAQMQRLFREQLEEVRYDLTVAGAGVFAAPNEIGVGQKQHLTGRVGLHQIDQRSDGRQKDFAKQIESAKQPVQKIFGGNDNRMMPDNPPEKTQHLIYPTEELPEKNALKNASASTPSPLIARLLMEQARKKFSALFGRLFHI